MSKTVATCRRYSLLSVKYFLFVQVSKNYANNEISNILFNFKQQNELNLFMLVLLRHLSQHSSTMKINFSWLLILHSEYLLNGNPQNLTMHCKASCILSPVKIL